MAEVRESGLGRGIRARRTTGRLAADADSGNPRIGSAGRGFADAGFAPMGKGEAAMGRYRANAVRGRAIAAAIATAAATFVVTLAFATTGCGRDRRGAIPTAAPVDAAIFWDAAAFDGASPPSDASRSMDGGPDGDAGSEARDDGSTADASATDATTVDGSAPLRDGGGDRPPTILTHGTNVTTLHPDESLIITAVVTDPDGVDDLIGGTLLDAGGSATYGAFATSAAEGSYSLTLSWSAIHAVGSIEAPPMGTARSFVMRFFDVAGHVAEATFSVTLRCRTSGDSACGGTCVDLQSDRGNCGRCGTTVPAFAVCRDGIPTCAVGRESLCSDGCFDLTLDRTNCGSCGNACTFTYHDAQCNASRCTMTDSFSTRTSCTDICARHAYTCTTTTHYYYDAPDYHGFVSACDLTPPERRPGYPSSTFSAVNCSCEKGTAMGCESGAENTARRCTDGCSNDSDGYIDCEDRDCCGVVTCAMGTYCNP